MIVGKFGDASKNIFDLLMLISLEKHSIIIDKNSLGDIFITKQMHEKDLQEHDYQLYKIWI